MFDRTRIRSKLALALAVPLVALVVLSSFVVVLSARSADDAEGRASRIRDQVELATAALGPTGVIAAVQNERNAEAIYQIGVDVRSLAGTFSGPLAEAPAALRKTDDETIAQFRQYVAHAHPAVRAAYEPAMAAIDRITAIRAETDASTRPRDFQNAAYVSRVVDLYTEVVQSIFDASSRLALDVDDAKLRNGAHLINLAAWNKEEAVQLTNQLALGAYTRTLDQRSGLSSVLEARTRMLSLEADIERDAPSTYTQVVERGLKSPEVNAYRQMTLAASNGEAFDPLSLVGPAAVKAWAALDDMHAGMSAQLQSDADALRASAEQEATDARALERNVALAALGVVVLAVAVTLLAARSISRPLHRLAVDAEDMATNRLPEAVKGILDTRLGEDVELPVMQEVPGGGGYEVNEVAGALNTVQRSAADLAVEQALLRRNIADSFINLGRRNQNLLSRQIDAITSLERDEADPGMLERLFALDHLATRMRRNAESLLLLGGLEPHRQWSEPVALIDVLRGALGEVEEYHRVAVRNLDDALVDGTVTADLAHLLAELIENALRFSPPDEDVEIIGRRTSAGYTLAIMDNGVGMSEAELERANLRLAGGESFTVAPSRYLGHYVVGVEAARLDVGVKLQHAPTGGVTAQVTLDAVLRDGAVAPSGTGGREEAAADGPAPGAPSAPAAGTPGAGDAAAADPTPATGPGDEELDDEPDLPAPVVGHLVDVPVVDDHVIDVPLEAAAPAPPPVAEVAPPSPVAPPAAASGVGTTASGYKRRVRGANVPRTDVLAAHRTDAPPESAAEPAQSSTAEGVRNLLSGLHDGTQRGRAEIERTFGERRDEEESDR